MAETVKKHPLMQEALKAADEAVTCNRGMYPVTSAANVIKNDGTPVEEDEE